MFSNIIVAVDGSDHSLKAVDLASDIAEKYDAELALVHVLTNSRLPESLKRFAQSEYQGTGETPEYLPHRVIAEPLLAEAAVRAERCGVKRIKQLIEEGDPAGCIVQVAADIGADLIVMGTRGLSDVGGILMGSVSHKVAHLATCACVTVK